MQPRERGRGNEMNRNKKIVKEKRMYSRMIKSQIGTKKKENEKEK